MFYHRLNDSTGTFANGSNLRFSLKQPCDAFIWNGKTKTFYAIEMKTTKSGSFSWEDINCESKQPTKMIYKHQIIALERISKYENVVSGFLFNFRLDNETIEHTYFQKICNFRIMTIELKKKSFNENDLLKYNPIKIIGTKKRTQWHWDLEKFLYETRLDN